MTRRWSSRALARPPWRGQGSGSDGCGCAPYRARCISWRPRQPELLQTCFPPSCVPASGSETPPLAERLAQGLQARQRLRKARARCRERRAQRGPWRPAGGSRFLPRCRGSLGAVRGRAGAGVRTPRPRAVLARALPADRGDIRPPTCPRDLLATQGRASARRGGRTPRAVARSHDETLTTGSRHRGLRARRSAALRQLATRGGRPVPGRLAFPAMTTTS